MSELTYHIITFGCQMNMADSEWLDRALTMYGFRNVSIDKAMVCIVNTCSVREKPQLKLYSTLGTIRKENKNPNFFSVVAGCVAQQLGQKLLDKFPEVRLVLGTDAIAKAPEAILKLCSSPDLRLNLTEFLPHFAERKNVLEDASAYSNPVSYVNIMQGCDNFCSYCIVPYTRGRQKSRNIDDIMRECESCISHGSREIILLGQNVNSFGLDHLNQKLSNNNQFAELIRKISKIDGLSRLRFITPHPKDLSDEIIELFRDIPILCPRIHLPLQSGSNSILQKMRRRYTAETYLELIEKLRIARQDIAISTDIIVGFPGETEADFNDTCRVAKQADFMMAFSFCYSDRPGTASEKMIDKIPISIKSERLAILQNQIEEQSDSWLQSRVGENTTVLIEGDSMHKSGDPNFRTWQGKDEWGDTVNISLRGDVSALGKIIPIKIIEAKKHSLVAQPLVIFE